MQALLLNILSTVFQRKIAKKLGVSKENALRDSTIMGAGATAAAIAVPEEVMNPALISLGLGPEYDLVLRIIIAAMGLYAVVTEKKS